MIINNYYIIPSNISHCEINLNKANKAKYYAVKLSDEISKTNEYPLIIDLKQKYQELNAFLQNAFHSFDNNDKNYALLNLACFYIALIKEIEKLDIYNHTAQASDFIYSESTKEIEYYLSKNYKEDVKIENLAAQYNISHSTLIKKFKKDLGVTPKEYLLKKRLDVSEELLRTSNYTITQISNFCGFISPAYFSLMFKKRFGLTPKEYRRNKKLFRLS